MPSVSAVALKDEKLLCMRRSNNSEWDWPGGYLELAEQPAEATVRGVFEETELEVQPERLLGVFCTLNVIYPNGDQVEMVITLFLCRVVGGELKARDGKALELCCFDVDALLASPLLARLPVSYQEPIKTPEASFVW